MALTWRKIVRSGMEYFVAVLKLLKVGETRLRNIFQEIISASKAVFLSLKSLKSLKTLKSLKSLQRFQRLKSLQLPKPAYIIINKIPKVINFWQLENLRIATKFTSVILNG